MPARPGGDCAAGPGVPRQAGSTAVIFGRWRKTRGSRSATAGASPPTSLPSTKPPPKEPDASSYPASPNTHAQIALARSSAVAAVRFATTAHDSAAAGLLAAVGDSPVRQDQR